MGKKVHVAKRYEVEYGSTEGFNNNDTVFYELLQTLGAEPNNVGAPDDTVSDIFECPVEKFDQAIRNLKDWIADPPLFREEDEIMPFLERLGMKAKQLLELMEQYINEADKRDGWMHFATF